MKAQLNIMFQVPAGKMIMEHVLRNNYHNPESTIPEEEEVTQYE